MLNNIIVKLKKNLSDKAFWLSSLKTLALIIIVVLIVTQYQQRDMSTGQAPTLEGINYSNGPTLVYFWGSWCPICRTTSPFVSTLAQEQEDNVVSIALSSGSDEEINHYLKEHDYQFDTINDDNGKISQSWGVAVTPSMFIIDTQGDIRFISTGITSLWGMKLRLWLASF
ncbi:MAG: protein disulfide oxidoreductase [Oleispira antarctica]|nr:protein disulfide oxidoreductase [Oleispira antarctica]MBQ0792923.1 protein disulfide oxidoreductase [Oleispira antarctica]